MALVFEFKYIPEAHKDCVFSSEDRKTLYTRAKKTDGFTCYQADDHSPTFKVSYEEFGFWVKYDLTELPILITDASRLPRFVYRSDNMVYANHIEVPFEDVDDTMYFNINGECFDVTIADIPLKV